MSVEALIQSVQEARSALFQTIGASQASMHHGGGPMPDELSLAVDVFHVAVATLARASYIEENYGD